ncbi:thioredoxin [Kallipyga gabonensis]|uniref:thioredoxin n=1 Tax=Kallipyga gabonensis TaxID=1686287 RepID=UPI0006B5872B|nr:thioredoxin [Kallipyga gabonensis]
MTQPLTAQDFKNQIKAGSGVVLVDFFATWCGPCKMMAPSLEELSEEGYQIFSVDVDQEKELAMEYGVFSIPTMILFKDGEKVDEFVGLTPKSTIKEKLDYLDN